MNAHKLSTSLLLFSLLLTSCGGVEPPRPGIDIPATPRAQIAGPAMVAPAQGETAEPTPVDLPPFTIAVPSSTTSEDTVVTVAIQAPETIRLHNVATIEVVLYAILPPSIVLDEIEIAMPVSLMAVEVLDGYPSIPGIQVIQSALPVNAEVLMNEMDEIGVIHYHVKGLGLQGQVEYPLFNLTVRAVYPGEMEIYILSLYARTADGTELMSNYDAFAISQILEEETAKPTPVLPPTTEPTVQPTEVAGGGNDGLPVIVPSMLQEGVYYRILRGENLYRIGLRFGINWQDIAAANGIRNEHYVPAGMILYIPVAAPVGSTAYYIRPGDTLYSICRALNLRVVDVAALNGISAPFNYIRADTWLKLAP